MGIVYRHMYLRDGHRLRERNDERMWKYRIRHAHMGEGIGHWTKRSQAHAKWHRCHANLRLIKLTHDFRHGPTFSVDVACASTTELFPIGVI